MKKNNTKRCYPMILSMLMAASGLVSADSAQAEPDSGQHKVHHVTIVWLKQHGDEQVRRQYIEESKRLAGLPGVIAYDIGAPAVIKRERPSSALDDSYDLAISSTYESQKAFEDFLKNPEYLRLAQEVLRPLVDKYKVYDFID